MGCTFANTLLGNLNVLYLYWQNSGIRDDGQNGKAINKRSQRDFFFLHTHSRWQCPMVSVSRLNSVFGGSTSGAELYILPLTCTLHAGSFMWLR